ncbi:hypothetical protein TNCV_4522921 [Trichonephila clavipes]|nr:hypothetical protein TNCV_4522921 [Trichonephila clavipes]
MLNHDQVARMSLELASCSSHPIPPHHQTGGPGVAPGPDKPDPAQRISIRENEDSCPRFGYSNANPELAIMIIRLVWPHPLIESELYGTPWGDDKVNICESMINLSTSLPFENF